MTKERMAFERESAERLNLDNDLVRQMRNNIEAFRDPEGHANLIATIEHVRREHDVEVSLMMCDHDLFIADPGPCDFIGVAPGEKTDSGKFFRKIIEDGSKFVEIKNG